MSFFLALEPVIPQKKPKKYGGKKGKAIDTAAAFNSYKVKQDEEYDFETIPTTRKGTTIVFVFVILTR